jgi:hypothetical protein
MKKTVKIIVAIVLLSGVFGYLYWQKNKNKIVKDLIVNSVSNLSDSLYILQYDSSMVDEVNGEAYFENVSIKSDSLHLNNLKIDNHLPDILMELHVKSISAKGLDIPLAVNAKKIIAKKIILNSPNIVIISTRKQVFKKEDTIAIFRKILGNYNSIRAENIEVINATFTHQNMNGVVNTKITKVNLSFTNITVDSTKDYNNVISYFINNMKANVAEIFINQPNRNSSVVINNVHYDAVEKNILIDKISTIAEGKNEDRLLITKLKLEDLNIRDFIEEQTISVGNICTEECMLTLFINKKNSRKTDVNKMKSFDLPNDYFYKIKIGGISIGKSTLILRNRTELDKPPIRINGFTFELSKNMKINERSTLRSILDSAKWNMEVEDFTLKSKDNNYTILFQGLKIDKATSKAIIQTIKVKPTLNEEALTNKFTYQKDIYNIEMNNLKLEGVDINQFINKSSLHIQELELHLVLKVYHDRSPRENPQSKVGKYPHQLLLNIDLPLNINKAIIKNSLASYRERSKETQEVGNVFFTNIEGEVNNITNLSAFIKQNPICVLKGIGLIQGKAKCNTKWRLFLDAKNGQFEFNGQIGAINFTDFNPLIKPLGLTTIEGQLNSIKFSMAGNDNRTKGDLTMLYNDLKLETFDFDTVTHLYKSKRTKSAVSNLFVKNNNPDKGETRLAKISVERNIQKSFFNLIWKGVYDGIQNTILNEKVAEIKKKMKENE